MNHKFTLIAACTLACLLTVLMSMGLSTASAQNQEDLCGLPLRGAIGGINATPTPNYYGGSYPPGYYGGAYGGNYGEDYYTPMPTPTATPLPQPSLQVSKSCEFGKVLIVVATLRNGTYRTGDVIAVDLYISTSNDVIIDFDTLLRQNLLVYGDTDFELVPSPTVETSEVDGRIQHHVQLRVRSFSLDPVLFLTVDLLYATDVVEGAAPGWKRLTTPQLVVTTTRTLDYSESPLEGDIQSRPSSGTWLSGILVLFGSLLTVLAVLFFAVPYILKAINRPRPVDANEVAWRKFDAALTRGKAKGFTRQDYAQIAAALRARLVLEPATLREIEIVNEGDSRLNDIRSALSKLDRIIFAPEGKNLSLNVKEIEQLERELHRIVPHGKQE